MENTLPIQRLDKAVEELHRLPGIGRKTALRLALFLLTQKEEMVENFGNTLIDFRKNIHYCRCCHNLSDTEICPICASPRRDHSQICVVSDIRDVMAIENTQQYKGVYHVLGGVISPMDGVGPSDLQIQSLVERVAEGGIREVILALSPTMEGDTTNFYIYRKLEDTGVRITVIARGVAQNDELQYTDEVTLGRSIVNRVVFTGQL